MRRARHAATALALVAALAVPDAGADATGAAPARPDAAGGSADAGTAACGWRFVSAPDPASARLTDIDGTGARNIWAVGAQRAAGAPLIMRWNGRRWSSIPAPAPSNSVALEGIDVRSSRDAWAVGWYGTPSGIRTLILRWNGTRWIRLPSPNPLQGANLLFDVAAVGPNTAWAVGTNNLNPGVGDRKIILRWTGRRWVNDGPGRARGSLESVAVRGGTVFATGRDGDGPLFMHRTANGWVKLPMRADPLQGLDSIDVAGSGPFRAVGTRAGRSRIATRAMHSVRGFWVEDSTPNRLRGLNVLHDVSARSGTEAWAVGYYETDSFVDRTLTLRLLNGRWSVVPSPNPNRSDTLLWGVYAVPNSRQVWAVGANAGHRLILRYHC